MTASVPSSNEIRSDVEELLVEQTVGTDPCLGFSPQPSTVGETSGIVREGCVGTVCVGDWVAGDSSQEVAKASSTVYLLFSL
jgi:hypothetical protein